MACRRMEWSGLSLPGKKTLQPLSSLHIKETTIENSSQAINTKSKEERFGQATLDTQKIKNTQSVNGSYSYRETVEGLYQFGRTIACATVLIALLIIASIYFGGNKKENKTTQCIGAMCIQRWGHT